MDKVARKYTRNTVLITLKGTIIPMSLIAEE